MILVLGGTSDSLKICDLLNKMGKSYILSVATDYGREISKNYCKDINVARLDKYDMIKFARKNNITIIIDATHPYALEVSQNAMDASRELGVKYIRYERCSSDILEHESIIKVDSIKEACDIANKIGENIFLSTGSKNLGQFVHNLKNKNIIARVLPTSEVLKSCESLGLKAHNIVAMKGPFSYDINKHLYKFYNCDLVITKESGVAGGFEEKLRASIDSNIKTIVILRPSLDYPEKIDDIEELNLQLFLSNGAR
ncbi:cobalt-precorrin-6A reductase [Tepidibacter aestuarii]|uniref:cobalt-precorrin-6A reductase n=1 Tax=Tepidibacter aestuarii TaxID=2925782 RepID=UPI0020C1824D|nr:cobalt-precorrin-6A reductase [Tepidibacter aestuarii]CAH2212014.1 Cobalt-precorrin-6A reductase [Tepidibacter aestuarii]